LKLNTLLCIALGSGLFLLTACASLMDTATSELAANLSAAILNQDDPETVRDGAPAYLLMLDSFVTGSPDNASLLAAAAELYAAYGVVFVDDPARAVRLTRRSKQYAERALCVSSALACGLATAGFEDYSQILEQLQKKSTPALYTYALTSLAYIKANASEPSALTGLPRAKAAFERLQELDGSYQPINREHYLAVLETIRPPALGGNFEAGLKHFENALRLSAGRDLTIAVDYANYYARTLYDRPLHDKLLGAVIQADPVAEGFTLFNTLAQRQARSMLETADDYF